MSVQERATDPHWRQASAADAPTSRHHPKLWVPTAKLLRMTDNQHDEDPDQGPPNSNRKRTPGMRLLPPRESNLGIRSSESRVGRYARPGGGRADAHSSPSRRDMASASLRRVAASLPYRLETCVLTVFSETYRFAAISA